ESLNYCTKTLRSNLRPIDRYVAANAVDPTVFSPSFFLSFRTDLKGAPGSKNTYFLATRGFFQYLVRLGCYEKNPMQDIPPYRENAYMPFIFSPGQIDGLLCAIQKKIRKTQKYFLNDLSVYIAMVLYARCGLRRTEALRLLIDHYRDKDGTIYIEKTKFNKDRLIPVPKCVVDEMNNYLAVRARFTEVESNKFLLPGRNGKGVPKSRIYKAFYPTVRDIGIDQPKRIVGNTTFNSPTVHSFRHSFAINTLKRIRDKGRSTQNALPILSTYMGHTKYRYTAVYLKYIDAEHRQ
ncbi:MAG: tyrosine-type recombinase/integrase, partial [candidate division Zixibacteria bacterium]|nr:tyrosine-type recombinase/integrase [candidate division Zixibacteria bacterium]